MIFVTVGTHDQEFTRLIRKIDEIAPKIKEKIIIQRGHTKYLPKNCKSFEFAPSLEPYYKQARLVIAQGASSAWEFVYKYNKPLIVVPRQFKYNEHINDHQVEFSEVFEKKTGVKAIYNINDLTPNFLKNYHKIGKINKENLINLQNYMKSIITNMENHEKSS
ncbi:MAG: glycosyltransferase [archaeon]|nr:glycosyltransferase [archaeon]